MSQGRGNAYQIAGLGSVLGALFLLALLQNVHGAAYTVGGPGGWTFNVETWPQGKRFRAGDLLKFNYDSTNHNVVVVNKDGYTNCKTPRGSKVFRSGNDQVKIVKGLNYFICNYPGHCESAMKIAVNAL